MPITGLHEPETRVSRGMAARWYFFSVNISSLQWKSSENAATTGVAWSTEEYDVEHLLSMASELVPPLRRDENTAPGWLQTPPPLHGNGHRPYDMVLGPSYQGRPVTDSDIWRFH